MKCLFLLIGLIALVSFGVSATASNSDEEGSAEDSVEELNPFQEWFKRALLPEPDSPIKKSSTKNSKKILKQLIKDASSSGPTTPKPTLVPDTFWAPPPTTLPNETVILPPGYWAAKKSMFVAKLFEALAMSVINSTGPPEETVTTTTTVSPQQAILDELQTVLLSDVARSLPSASSEEQEEQVTEEPSEQNSVETKESEEEQPTQTVSPLQKLKGLLKGKAGPKVKTTTPAPTTTTINPFLLGKMDFLEKLSEAIAAEQAKIAAGPVGTTTPQPPTSKKGSKKTSKKSSKKTKTPPGPTTPKWMKYVPTTTTTPAPPTINYDALAKMLLGQN